MNSECRVVVGGYDPASSCLSDVLEIVANVTGYKNNGMTGSSHLPLLNLTETIPGPLNPQYWIPYLAPNTSGTGGGSGPTFVANGTNMSMTTSSAPVNLTATHATATGGALGGFAQANLLASAMSALLAGALLL